MLFYSATINYILSLLDSNSDIKMLENILNLKYSKCLQNIASMEYRTHPMGVTTSEPTAQEFNYSTCDLCTNVFYCKRSDPPCVLNGQDFCYHRVGRLYK